MTGQTIPAVRVRRRAMWLRVAVVVALAFLASPLVALPAGAVGAIMAHRSGDRAARNVLAALTIFLLAWVVLGLGVHVEGRSG